MARRVLIFGTFDVLHPGHLDLFKQARALGDELHVVVARDKTVIDVKKQAPQQNESERLAAVGARPEVTKVYLGNLGSKYDIVEDINPDIIALGYDQTHFIDQLQEELRRRGLHAEIVRLKPHREDIYKSSKQRKGKR